MRNRLATTGFLLALGPLAAEGAVTSHLITSGKVASFDNSVNELFNVKDGSPAPVGQGALGDDASSAATLRGSEGGLTLDSHGCSGPPVWFLGASAYANSTIHYNERFVVESDTLPNGTPITINVRVGAAQSFIAEVGTAYGVVGGAATVSGSAFLRFDSPTHSTSFSGTFAKQLTSGNDFKSQLGIFASSIGDPDEVGERSADDYIQTLIARVGGTFDITVQANVAAESSSRNPDVADADGQMSLSWGADVEGGLARIVSPDDDVLFPSTSNAGSDQTLENLPISRLSPDFPEPAGLGLILVGMSLLTRRTRRARGNLCVIEHRDQRTPAQRACARPRQHADNDISEPTRRNHRERFMSTNHQQRSRRPASRFARTTGAILLKSAFPLGLALSAGNALGQTTNWTNPIVGNWFIDTNWNAGVPQGGSIAQVNNNGLALLNSPGGAAAFLNLGTAGSGFLDVSGAGRLTLDGRLIIGTGKLQVVSGGQVTVLNNPNIGRLTEVGQSGRSGQLVVNGAGSFLSAGRTTVGRTLGGFDTPVGTARVENGGSINSDTLGIGVANPGASGAATVTGTNSLWTVSNELLIDGASSSLTISSFGRVNAGFTNIRRGATVNVTGAGSALNNSTSSVGIRVGEFGSATLNVQNGGGVSSVNAVVGATSSMFPGTGTVTITGMGSALGSTWGTTGRLLIGGDESDTSTGGTGVLTVSAGGLLQAGTTEIGRRTDSVGNVVLTGSASRWENTQDVLVGGAGRGTLEIRDGGTLTSIRGLIGNVNGGVGTTFVADPGSSWAASGDVFVGINTGSTGTLHVFNGGLARTRTNSFLGYRAGSRGTASVSGAGSAWNTAGTLAIGGDLAAAAGTGALQIGDGGSVTAANILLYNTGTITLTNATTLTGPLTSTGGRINTFGNTALANNVTLGAGGLTVVNQNSGTNAHFTGNISGTGGLIKGALVGSTATLTLAGANTYTGATTVAAGGLLVNGSLTSATTVNAGFLGGTGAIAAPVTIGNGIGNDDAIIAPGASAGTLATGDLTLNDDAVYAFELNSATALADQIDVTGTVSLSPDARFTFTDLGAGELTPGLSFILINNDGDDAIAGTFANLAEGSVFADGANGYEASYVGGTGNDLVLTVVPEPAGLGILALGGLILLHRRRRMV